MTVYRLNLDLNQNRAVFVCGDKPVLRVSWHKSAPKYKQLSASYTRTAGRENTLNVHTHTHIHCDFFFENIISNFKYPFRHFLSYSCFTNSRFLRKEINILRLSHFVYFEISFVVNLTSFPLRRIFLHVVPHEQKLLQVSLFWPPFCKKKYVV